MMCIVLARYIIFLVKYICIQHLYFCPCRYENMWF